MDGFLRSLGQRIKQIRRELGMNQERLSERAGVTPKYVSEIENGLVNPSVLVLRGIAEKGFKMPLAALFAFDVSSDESRAMSREISATLSALPSKERKRALHVLKSLIG